MDTGLKQGDKLNIIPPEAIIKVELSGSFYADLQQQLWAMLEEQMNQGKDPLDINKRLKELEKAGFDPKNLWEVQICTLLGLIFAIEKAAKEQGHMIEREALDVLKENSSEEASPEN